jgi:ABC-type transport system involved in cytochrome bd biosynthesis fused ATPase/permease subunit
MIVCSGFIYCIVAFHYKILKGDELKLRIHLESLNAAFTISLVIFFALAFVFLNFAPTLLNYIMVIIAIVFIVSYLLATQFIRDKYQ